MLHSDAVDDSICAILIDCWLESIWGNSINVYVKVHSKIELAPMDQTSLIHSRLYSADALMLADASMVGDIDVN